jgi:hypothetical protein
MMHVAERNGFVLLQRRRVVRRALDAGNGELAHGLSAGDQGPAQRAAEDVLGLAAAAQEVRLHGVREGVVAVGWPLLGVEGRVVRQGHEIKLLGGGFELRDEDLEGVVVVAEWE